MYHVEFVAAVQPQHKLLLDAQRELVPPQFAHIGVCRPQESLFVLHSRME
jgi:hypothetical protein